METKGMKIMNKGIFICFVLLLFTTSGCVGLSPRYGNSRSLNKKVENNTGYPENYPVKHAAQHKIIAQNKTIAQQKTNSHLQAAALQNKRDAEGKPVTMDVHPVPVTNHGDSTKIDKSKGITGGTLSDLAGYRPGRIASHHVPFSRKYKKDKNKHHVELAFDNADLYEVLDATLFDIYGVNYIVDPHIRAKVTFHFKGDYSRDQFIELLNNVLQMDNLAIVKGPGDMFKVVMKNASAAFGNSPPGTSASVVQAGDITRIFKLRYLSAASASTMVRGFVSRGASVIFERVGNSIVVTDSRANIDKVARILALTDIPYFRDIHWRLIPLKEADASELNREISRILKSGGLFNRAGVNRGSYAIVPIKSLNALLVVSKWPEIISLVEKWSSALDHGDNGTGTGVFVYFVQNGKADELSDILKGLYGGKISKSTRKKIVEPNRPNRANKSNKKNTVVKNKKPIISGDLSGNVEIIPDDTNNAIVFKATARDYKLIKSVLKQLDVVPRQALINVVVAEITLTRDTQYGIQWFFDNKLGKYKAVGMLDTKDSFITPQTKLGDITGFNYGVFSSSNVLKGLITALGNDSDVNILSSPNILAVNNKEADIEVSEDVPTITGSVTDSTGGGVTNTVQYKKTGIILKVTPHINSRGLVKLDLEQEVSAPGEFDKNLQNFSFLTRKATTSAVVEDGQTMILGGMMKTNVNNSTIGVPFLKDIPVVGNFFKSTTKKRTKTELIFLITTHVIYNREDADRITNEFSKTIKGVKKLIEDNKK